jgi:hypothetical protein
MALRSRWLPELILNLLQRLRFRSHTLVAAFVSLACGREPVRSGEMATPESVAAPAVALDTTVRSETLLTGGTPGKMTCTPTTLRAGDTLTLNMPVPHGQYLAVSVPDGRFFFLVSEQLLDAAYFWSLVPAEAFRTIPTFRIPTDVRARPSVYGRTLREAVFVEPGTYRITMGENLSTDYGPPVASCDVVFTSRQR